MSRFLYKQIHIVAKDIYCTSSSIANVAFVITTINTYSKFTLFVSIALLWAGFREITGQTLTLFRICQVSMIDSTYF